MKKISIHQFSPSAVRGDGIGNGMFYLQKILLDLGFISNIYAENIESSLKGEVISYKKIDKKDNTQILLIHYSIYYDFSQWIDKLDMRKIMIYHNITPYQFFKKGTILYKLCKKGIEYLPELSNRVEGAIGDSNLNSKELIEHNFKNVKTIPLLIDTKKILSSKWDSKLFDKIADDFNIIFIGRVAKNKAQHDLIEIANIYRKISDSFKLYIIGGVTDSHYKDELESLILRYGLEKHIVLTGKVSDEQLFAYYRGANLFLCMSEHEGFGIPLIESMLFNLPIIAYNSSNIKDTLNGGAILFNKKSYSDIAATIHLIRTNRAFRRAVIQTQIEAKERYSHKNIVKDLVEYLKSIGVTPPKEYKVVEKSKRVKYQFEGPYDSSYSLAILNRYSALAFNKKYPNQVSLFATEGGGDYTPDSKFLSQNPEVQKIANLSKKYIDAKVVFRNLYPPRVAQMSGELNILNSYGWEESSFPLEYVNSFNENLDGITVMSHYVKEVLSQAGVKRPIEVVGLGVEHILEAKPKEVELNTTKGFKFLHISSCFPRKGVDILLQAYIEQFSNLDDVTLIIKTFPNPHNRIEDEVKRIKQNSNSPEIILINQELSDGEIAWLYKNSNALVAPSRGEGFGLPMAEAMLFRLPVITTAFGGQIDFCKQDNSWLIDYSFAKAKTHLNLFNSYWVEPNIDHLKEILGEITLLSKDKIAEKSQRAYSLISNHFRWEDYRAKTEKFIAKLENEEVFSSQKINLAWVSSYNTKCGIATYSEFLLSKLSSKYSVNIFANYSNSPICDSKEKNIIRCWENRFDKDNTHLIENIITSNSKRVVINFNFGFFSTKNLKEIIDRLTLANIKIVIIFHSVADITIEGLEASLKDIRDSLKKVYRLLLHTIDDLNFFKSMDLTNISLLPHGVTNRDKDIVKNREIKTISSYGFLLPHKGILELIEAFALLKRDFSHLKLLLVNAIYPIPKSKEYYEKIYQIAKELRVLDSIEFQTDFLEDKQSFKLLDSSDLIVMPYRQTNESASGAIRYALSTLNPILCTPQPIFNDVADIVHFTDDFSVKSIADSIKYLIKNPKSLYSKLDKQQSWIREHDWSNIVKRLEYFIG